MPDKDTAMMQLANRETLLDALLRLSDTGKLTFLQTDNPAYVSALCDLLQMLRLVQRIEGGVAVDGEMARLFVRSLAAHLADNVPMALDWHARVNESVEAAHGRQLLAAVENSRKDNVSNPTPVREIYAVNAVIKGQRAGQDYLLMQYDEHAAQFQLIGGKREPEDLDAAHTLLREIQEELGLPDLKIPKDMSFMPIGERFEQISLSPTYGVVTSYHISFFHVLNMAFRPVVDGVTRWISMEYVRRGNLPDGRKVSDLVVQSLTDCLDDLAYSIQSPVPVD